MSMGNGVESGFYLSESILTVKSDDRYVISDWLSSDSVSDP